jgi:hypothetical protein
MIKVLSGPAGPTEVKGNAPEMRLREAMVYRRGPDVSNDWPGFINVLDLDTEENLYVLDPREGRVFCIDRRSRTRWTFGNTRDLHDEFGLPVFIKVFRQNDIAVCDILTGRIVYLDLRGRIKKTVDAAEPHVGFLAVDSRGRQFFVRTSGKGNARELVRYDPASQHFIKIDTLARSVGGSEPGGAAAYHCALREDDSFAWMSSSRYEIVLLNPEGQTVMRISRGHEGRSTGVIKNGGSVSEEVVRGLWVDDKNRFFACVAGHGPDGMNRYDVFDAEGAYIARFSLDGAERIGTIKNGCIYSIVNRTPEGLPWIRKYLIDWGN